MTWYRVLKNLTTGHRRGELVNGARFKVLEALVRHGALSRVRFPPLEALDGWDERIAALAGIGVTEGERLMDADAAALADALGSTPHAVACWQEELAEAVTVHAVDCTSGRCRRR